MATLEQKRLALERVLESDTFARADQLKSFLRYVCEMEFSGREDEISEYLIGVRALGKPEGFSTVEDTSVRNRAYALRQKLEQFYADHPDPATLRIEFRKGTYVPRFAEPPATPPESAADEPGLAPDVPRPSRFSVALGAILGLAVGVGATWMWLSGSAPARRVAPPDPALRQVWGPLFEPDASVVVGVATAAQLTVLPFAVRVETLPAVPTLPLPAPLADWYLRHQRSAQPGSLFMVPNDNSPHFGDMLGAMKVSRLLEAQGARTELFPERLIRTSTLTDRNLVLFGVPYKSESARKMLEGGRFEFRFDADRNDVVIADQAMIYPTRRDAANSRVESYTLVTVRLRRHTNGRDTRVVVFSGDPSAGSAAAVDFLSNPVEVSKLAAKMGGQLPPSFQLLLRTRIDENLPQSASYVAHSALND